MILVGYQGVGKSTLAGKGKYIDLESGNFWVNGRRSNNWYKVYCNIAEHLSAQGYNVFVSSHEVVREQLRNSEEKVVVIYPSLELKDFWIQKLKTRLEESKLTKDYKAYMNAVDKYEENIKDLMNEDHDHVVIDDKDYNLYWLLALMYDI